MTTARQELIAQGRQAIAELTAQHREAVSLVVDVVREFTGVSLVPATQPPIMDATRAQLEDAAGRARHALRAMDDVLGVSWGDATTLGQLIRDPYWSGEDRERIAESLARAGLS